MPKLKAIQPCFLLRDLSIDVVEKLKVAASLHRSPMKDYIQGVLEAYLKELERKGITLSLPQEKNLRTKLTGQSMAKGKAWFVRAF